MSKPGDRGALELLAALVGGTVVGVFLMGLLAGGAWVICRAGWRMAFWLLGWLP